MQQLPLKDEYWQVSMALPKRVVSQARGSLCHTERFAIYCVIQELSHSGLQNKYC